MGATSFVEVMQGYDSPTDAYQEARYQGIYEYGHNPYNGTISTTEGYQYLGEIPEKDVEEFIEKNIDNFNKWGLCGCVKSDDKYIFFGWAAI